MNENVVYVECPFCEECDFDLVGLKVHLLRGGCKEFDDTESPEQEHARRLLRQAEAEKEK